MVSIKAIGIAIKLTLEGINQAAYPQTWLFASVAVICVFTQLNYLNKVGKSLCDVTNLSFWILFFHPEVIIWSFDGRGSRFLVSSNVSVVWKHNLTLTWYYLWSSWMISMTCYAFFEIEVWLCSTIMLCALCRNPQRRVCSWNKGGLHCVPWSSTVCEYLIFFVNVTHVS